MPGSWRLQGTIPCGTFNVPGRGRGLFHFLFDDDRNQASHGRKPKPRRHEADELTAATDLHIVGGRFRGRKLKYEPFRIGDDPVTRPMKHRVRESIFNLADQGSEGRHAIDLFAGTGALGLEALSRGAVIRLSLSGMCRRLM